MCYEDKLAGGPIGPFFSHEALSAAHVAVLYGLGRTAPGL